MTEEEKHTLIDVKPLLCGVLNGREHSEAPLVGNYEKDWWHGKLVRLIKTEPHPIVYAMSSSEWSTSGIIWCDPHEIELDGESIWMYVRRDYPDHYKDEACIKWAQDFYEREFAKGDEEL